MRKRIRTPSEDRKIQDVVMSLVEKQALDGPERGPMQAPKLDAAEVEASGSVCRVSRARPIPLRAERG